ncbi:zinc finger CCHC domain-containing protein 14 isoform X1 [Ochotona curzoniae]|uniref:zinc finger CCHC domain-containing protein 14 isoform X1 n=1 Tax=Ochotona curzoniae TaxID=130825 RepID=UPI001B348BD7|nr:zinc finger CCHC domain-containing protein 14 isoform X1 [Ochotona curzoniae]
MVEKRCPLQRDGVYRWFSELPSPQRVEFLCGLLDLCIPLELRFLGSCLEDLARKDYHSLRDSEIKANNPADLGSLTNLTDEVVRSKLLVSLALLGSEQREAAGVLYRTLTHIDSIIHNYGLQLNEGRTGDEFLLLFTMASNHPAFSFHQKQVLRQELTQIQSSLSGGGGGGPAGKGVPTCPACHKVTPRTEAPGHSGSHSLESALHTSAHSAEEPLPKRPLGKHGKVSVEKVDLKGLSHTQSDRNVDCSFEVLWSDSSVTSVTKSSCEVTEFISKLSQLHPEESSEKLIPCLAAPEPFYAERSHVDLDTGLRYLSSLPSHVLKNDHVKKFFSTAAPSPPLPGPSPGNPSLSKVGAMMGVSGRPVCGVAGIPASQSSAQHHLPHAASAATALPHCSHSAGAGSALAYRTQMDASPAILMPSGLQAPQTQEQNGILDWLRKLRLHKYYPVFKQLTMEKFLSLTEEDLNKFESLTMGAKKKLKTQLELEKEKSERRCLNPSATPLVTSSGVARVPPTSHVGPVQTGRGSHAAELRVDVEQPSHQLPREGSSSEYSSSSSSPRGVQAREESSDSAEENERRVETLEGPEKEKPVMLLSHFTSSAARPTAQVLPVQNEAGSGPAAHHPLPPQMLPAASHLAPIRMLNSVHKSERGGSDVRLLSPSVHSLLSLEERGKGSGPRGSVKVDKSFGSAMMDVLPTSSPHQPMQVLSGLSESSSLSPAVSFGPRAKVVHASTLDRVLKTAQQPALAGESSTAATGTPSSVLHVARPPIKLLLSSSVPADTPMSGQTSCPSNVQLSVPPAVISPRNALYTASTKVAFPSVSSLPVSPLQAGFCASSNTASSSSLPATSFANMATLPSCPAPSSSPALASVPENSFYSSGAGGGSSTGNMAASSQGHHHHHHHQQPPAPPQPAPPPPGCIVCTSCGCSGSCGSGGLTVSYANYFQHPFSGPSVFTLPFLPFSPVCSNGYVGAQQYGGGSTFPVVHAPYSSSVPTEPVLGGQSTFAVPPMQNFMAGPAGMYQAQGLVGGSNGSGHKKSGNLSCYNCGATGHRAQDCKQPSMDFNRQGTFRLKYAPPAESLDSTD